MKFNDFELDVMPYLKEHGYVIGKLADKGNENCKRIIQYYSMLTKCFDPGFSAFLMCELEIYANSKEEKLLYSGIGIGA